MTAPTPLLRAPLRGGIAVLAVVTLVLQIWLAVPLALRMSGGIDAPPGATLCTSHPTATTTGDPDAPQGPPSAHAHDHCVLCRGTIAPPLLPVALVVLLGPLIWTIGLAAPVTARRDQPRALPPYTSRAPPRAA